MGRDPGIQNPNPGIESRLKMDRDPGIETPNCLPAVNLLHLLPAYTRRVSAYLCLSLCSLSMSACRVSRYIHTLATGDVPLQVAFPISGLTMIGIALPDNLGQRSPQGSMYLAFERFRASVPSFCRV